MKIRKENSKALTSNNKILVLLYLCAARPNCTATRFLFLQVTLSCTNNEQRTYTHNFTLFDIYSTKGTPNHFYYLYFLVIVVL